MSIPSGVAAIQFPACHPAVTCVLGGDRPPAEAEDAVRMTAALWTDLRTEGLLR